MTSILRSMFPGSSSRKEDHEDDDYSLEYSFAMEYSGPPVSHDIPRVVPVDVRRIPTAAAAAKTMLLRDMAAVPVIQPIVKKSGLSNKKPSPELKTGLEISGSPVPAGKGRIPGRVYSRKPNTGPVQEAAVETREGANARSSTSSGTLGFSEGHCDSNQLSGSSDVEELDEDDKASASHEDILNRTLSDPKQPELRSDEISSSSEIEEEEDDIVEEAEASGQGNRTAVVTFRDLPSNCTASQISGDDDPDMYPARPVVADDGRKGLCHRCNKKNRFSDKEVCVVCGAKYCSNCVLRSMGCMPEGRKCITCIGYRIDESRRGSLGKCSKMLKKLLTKDAIKKIMDDEMSCEVNQIPPHLVFVNENPLSFDELILLQSCRNPPKKLRPGRYWYDKVSGFWGKEGEKPCQIISAQLAISYPIKRDASNGNTNVMINSREITKAELKMLKAAGIHCEGNPHFWVTADGSCQHEGMKNVMGKLWEKKRVKILCAALNLPFPSHIQNVGNGEVDKNAAPKINFIQQRKMNKILLVGGDQSGTSTIFKQAKNLYNVPFSEDEKQNIKYMIQRNLYTYIAILLDGHEHFEEEYLNEMRLKRAEEPGPSEIEPVEEKNPNSLSPKLKSFSNWLLQVMVSGNIEAIFPAATREYSPMVEELWKDRSFQSTYKRRNELHTLPRVANYFLDRAVEISRVDYEPTDMDVLYAEGFSSSNGVAFMEFSFPKLSQDGYMEASDQNDPPMSYDLIRVHASSLGEKCKWLEMFEDFNLVIYCVSLTDYDEYHEDMNGVRTNKMMATKNLFETIATHPTLTDKHFLLILNKFDLLEEKIEQVPLKQCEWFQDFDPVISIHPHSANGNNNPPLAQRAFHYVAVKFKRLFNLLTGRKLFVSRVTGLEADSVDKALRYGKEILKWEDERQTVSMGEYSTESIEPSASV